MTEPRERPILFNTWSVQRILDGDKVQTRRVIKCDPKRLRVVPGTWGWPDYLEHRCPLAGWHEWISVYGGPYGAPGNRLWVRETWQLLREWGDGEETGLEAWPKGRSIPKSFPDGWMLEYRADKAPGMDEGPWRPSIFMPRWASRVLLELDEVRVERVQDMVDTGAVAEGIPWNSARSETMAFAQLWDEINAHRGYGWDFDPWVWCLTFHILERRDR